MVADRTDDRKTGISQILVPLFGEMWLPASLSVYLSILVTDYLPARVSVRQPRSLACCLLVLGPTADPHCKFWISNRKAA